MSAPNYDPLFYWVKERENIRLTRKAGEPKPWTADPILKTRRFCNVRREDDTVTVWIREQIRERFAGHPLLWFMLCVGRQINWPETLAELIATPKAWPGDDDFEPGFMTEALKARETAGKQVYTGVYTIHAPQEKGTSKHPHVAEKVLGNLWLARDRFNEYFAGASLKGRPNLQKTHAMISGFLGWGPFMAYQAVVDMRFTALLDYAEDVDRWAAAGPGTIRGLNRIHGRHKDTKLSQEQALAELRAAYRVVPDITGVEMDFSDVPNIFCEVDKLIRRKNGEGDLRQKYPGEAETD